MMVVWVQILCLSRLFYYMLLDSKSGSDGYSVCFLYQVGEKCLKMLVVRETFEVQGMS